MEDSTQEPIAPDPIEVSQPPDAVAEQLPKPPRRPQARPAPPPPGTPAPSALNALERQVAEMERPLTASEVILRIEPPPIVAELSSGDHIFVEVLGQTHEAIFSHHEMGVVARLRDGKETEVFVRRWSQKPKPVAKGE